MLALAIMDAPQQLSDRCDNWGEAMRWKIRASVSINGRGPNLAPTKTYFARVGGLETQYRSPQSQHWHYGSAPTAAPSPDEADAAVIERAACSLEVYYHAILRYHHVHLLAAPVVLRLAAKAGQQQRTRGGDGALQGVLTVAYGLLGNALTVPAVIQRQRALDRVASVLEGFKGLPNVD